MKNRLKLLIFLLLPLFYACETEIDVTLPEYKEGVVVEGFIELGEYAEVSLYKTLPYLSEIQLNNLLEQVIIQDALVIIKKGGWQADTLQLVQSSQAPLHWFYQGSVLKGEPNTEYELQIEWKGKKFVATTSILEPRQLDTVRIDPLEGIEMDSIGRVYVAWKDDPAVRNYSFFRLKFANELYRDRTWLTCFPVAIDDITFPTADMNLNLYRFGATRWFMPTHIQEQDYLQYFRPYCQYGDTIYVKASAIDAASFQFLNSMMVPLYFGDNPLGNPPLIHSNIRSLTGDPCFGSWIGTASTEYMIIFDQLLR